MYAIAASAAGVSLLALAQPSEAKIVYTRTHQVTSPQHPVNIDLNHDGIIDFALVTYYAGGSTFDVGVRIFGSRSNKNGIVGKGYYPSALQSGIGIGPKKQFGYCSRIATEGFNSGRGTTQFRGLWQKNGKGVTDRFFGLKFMVKGQVHYGWARVSVQLGKFETIGDVVATLTGYAYETIPNKPIIAGNIVGPAKGPDDADNRLEQPNPAGLAPLTSHRSHRATLGILAMGSPALFIWRRKESRSMA